MEGYVKNISHEWAYAMKRSVRPGGEIPLKELYEQYGKKYDMTPDDQFIDWLKNIKLKNAEMWAIVFDLGDGQKSTTPINAPAKASISPSAFDEGTHTHSVVVSQMQVADIVNLSVRKAKDLLPRIMDLTLLKYSLNEARQLTEKDSLCRLIQKRISELQISR